MLWWEILSRNVGEGARAEGVMLVGGSEKERDLVGVVIASPERTTEAGIIVSMLSVWPVQYVLVHVFLRSFQFSACCKYLSRWVRI